MTKYKSTYLQVNEELNKFYSCSSHHKQQVDNFLFLCFQVSLLKKTMRYVGNEKKIFSHCSFSNSKCPFT